MIKMIEITLSTLLQVIQTIGLLVGIIYYITIMRNQSRTREAQFLLQLSQRFQDKENFRDFHEVLNLKFKDYQDFLENWDSTVNYEAYLQRSTIWFMLDTFGHILKRGLVKPETIYDAIGGAFISRMWDNHGPIIRELRKQINNPHHLDGYEYCAEEMKKVERRKLQSIA